MRLDLTFSLDSAELDNRFWAYYFFTTHAIRGPEIPLITRGAGSYTGNNMLLNGTATNTITIRLYAGHPFSNVYWDFRNTLVCEEKNGQLSAIQLYPVAQLERLGSPVLIGQYNPFRYFENTERYELTAYYIGNQVGFTHEVKQLANRDFELMPKLFLLMDLEQERYQIEKNHVSFGGYLNTGKNG